MKAKRTTKVVVEHMGLKLAKPNAKTSAKIDRAFERAKKTGQLVSDMVLRPHAHKS